MSASVDVVVLCEDVQAWVFCLRALVAAGHDRRRIRVVPYPALAIGSGAAQEGRRVHACGSQHVRERFPAELQLVRRRASSHRASLVVHIDVDNPAPDGRTVDDRLTELDDACDAAGVLRRGPNDPVAVLVPRRNIETWIYFYRNERHPVDEHSEYPKLDGHESDAAPAAEAFVADARRKPAPGDVPDALRRGLTEFRRVMPPKK
jgi:hypothetical protein